MSIWFRIGVKLDLKKPREKLHWNLCFSVESARIDFLMVKQTGQNPNSYLPSGDDDILKADLSNVHLLIWLK